MQSQNYGRVSTADSGLFSSILSLQWWYFSHNHKFWILSSLTTSASGSIWWKCDCTHWYPSETGWTMVISVCLSHSTGTGMWNKLHKYMLLLWLYRKLFQLDRRIVSKLPIFFLKNAQQQCFFAELLLCSDLGHLLLSILPCNTSPNNKVHILLYRTRSTLRPLRL